MRFCSPSYFGQQISNLLLSFDCRRLLDAALLRAFDSGRVVEVAESPVVGAMLMLLMTDGMATIATRVGS